MLVSWQLPLGSRVIEMLVRGEVWRLVHLACIFHRHQEFSVVFTLTEISFGICCSRYKSV